MPGWGGKGAQQWLPETVPLSESSLSNRRHQASLPPTSPNSVLCSPQQPSGNVSLRKRQCELTFQDYFHLTSGQRKGWQIRVKGKGFGRRNECHRAPWLPHPQPIDRASGLLTALPPPTLLQCFPEPLSKHPLVGRAAGRSYRMINSNHSQLEWMFARLCMFKNQSPT